MVKNIIRKWRARKVMKIVKEYAKEVKKNYDVEAIILFGSYVKGTSHKDSDIDIVVVTNDIKNNIYDEELNLMKLRWNIDYRIEPHLIEVDDYRNVSNPFVKEVIETGVRII